MIFQEILVGIFIFISPIFPPILVPLAFSMIGYLVVQGANPRILSSIMVGSTTLAMGTIRMIELYIIKKMAEFKEEKKRPDFFSAIREQAIGYLIKTSKANKASKRVDTYLSTRTGKVLIFCLAVFCSAPTVPDIITTRIFLYKMKRPAFMIAIFLGKIISFVPFIFFGKGILTIILK